MSTWTLKINFVLFIPISISTSFYSWCAENIPRLLFHFGFVAGYRFRFHVSAHATHSTDEIVCQKLARFLSKWAEHGVSIIWHQNEVQIPTHRGILKWNFFPSWNRWNKRQNLLLFWYASSCWVFFCFRWWNCLDSNKWSSKRISCMARTISSIAKYRIHRWRWAITLEKVSSTTNSKQN